LFVLTYGIVHTKLSNRLCVKRAKVIFSSVHADAKINPIDIISKPLYRSTATVDYKFCLYALRLTSLSDPQPVCPPGGS